MSSKSMKNMDPARYGFVNHLALIACFISYKKWVRRAKSVHLRPAHRNNGMHATCHTSDDTKIQLDGCINCIDMYALSKTSAIVNI